MATFSPTPRLIVLISGDGNQLQALIDHTTSTPQRLYAHIIHVVSNRKAAHGLTRAANAGIPTTYHNLIPYKKQHKDAASAREAYDADLAGLILAHSPDLVVCVGWTHILSAMALQPLADARVGIVNVCQSIPGHFYVSGESNKCLEATKKGRIPRVSVMLHWVSEEVGRGKVIYQRSPRIFPWMDLWLFERLMGKVERLVILIGTASALRKQREEREAAGLVWSTCPIEPDVNSNRLSF